MPLEEAVKRAVDDCIDEGILTEFLLEQKAEVIAMSIYEYNEEYARKTFFEEGVESGYAQGLESGYAQGVESGYTEGVDSGSAKRLVQSVESLMKNCAWDEQRACESIGVTVEEYEQARVKIADICENENENIVKI